MYSYHRRIHLHMHSVCICNSVNPVPANLIMCDMLLGSVEKIIQSNVVLRLLKRLHLVPLIVIHRDKSYQVQTEVFE